MNMKNGKVYLVGGAVRDHLLGIQSKDHDYVVVGSTQEEMIEAGFEQVGASFPVFLHPETRDEWALARTERKTGVGYHGFDTIFDSSITLEDDLMRRDLTINAMAMTENFQIIDPFNGIADLEAGILRHTSEAFADDPLRVLRLARFAARYKFSVAPETMELAKKLVASGELDALPRERIWTELYKGFSEKDPSLMLKVLQESNALTNTPLSDYFGHIDVDQVKVLSDTADSIVHGFNVSKTDVNVMFAMSHLATVFPKMVQMLKVPNFIYDAILLESLLFRKMNAPMTAESIHKVFKNTRFVTDSGSDTMQLALFVASVRSMVAGDYRMFVTNFLKLNTAAHAVRSLDMAAVVASGDMKTVKSRVDEAKLNAIKSVV